MIASAMRRKRCRSNGASNLRVWTASALQLSCSTSPNKSGGVMSEVVYRSEVRIERVKGPVRRAYLPAESEPVVFGVHGAIAEHYKAPSNVAEPRAATLDYIVAAAAG